MITNVQALQSLTVDRSMEQEKQKAEVKHIHLQKQRALADLFKMLAQIGQSELFNVVLENVFINQGSFLFYMFKYLFLFLPSWSVCRQQINWVLFLSRSVLP